MKLVLGYPPSLNHLYATVKGRRVLSREGRRYKAAMAESAAAQGTRPLLGDIRVEAIIYRPRRIGDLDNRFKALLDCLKGVAWEDDKQVVALAAERKDDPANPRVEVVIESVVAPLVALGARPDFEVHGEPGSFELQPLSRGTPTPNVHRPARKP